MDDSTIFGVVPHEKKKFKSYVFHNRSFSNDELIHQIDELNRNKEDYNFTNRLMFEMYNSNKLILEDKIIPEGVKYSDLIECINLNRTIVKFRKVKGLSLDLVLSVHKELTTDLLSEVESGVLRKVPVYISNCLHTTPDAELVEGLLKSSINKFNKSNKTLVDIFIFKLEFVSIHPFVDGNGRVSRILMNGLLEYYGYPRLIVTERNKKFYYKALEDAQVRYMTGSWIRYCLLLMKFNLEYLNDVDILI